MAMSMLMSRLLLMSNLQTTFLTASNHGILIHIASMEIARLKSLLSLATVLSLVHRMISPSSCSIVCIQLGVSLMLRLNWSVLDPKNINDELEFTYDRFFLLL